MRTQRFVFGAVAFWYIPALFLTFATRSLVWLAPVIGLYPDGYGAPWLIWKVLASLILIALAMFAIVKDSVPAAKTFAALLSISTLFTIISIVLHTREYGY